MAIAEMSIMTLVALKRDKSALLDSLKRTRAVQIKSAKDFAFTQKVFPADDTDTQETIDRIEKAIDSITRAVERLDKSERPSEQAEKDGFETDDDEFFAVASKGDEVLGVVSSVERTEKRRAEIRAMTLTIGQNKKLYSVYSCLSEPFSVYSSSLHARVRLGTVDASKADALVEKAAQIGAQAEVKGRSGQLAVVCVVYHASAAAEAETALAESGFSKCPFVTDDTAAQKLSEIEREGKSLQDEEKAQNLLLASLTDKTRLLKLYADYLTFCVEKNSAEKDFKKTARTILIEAYVPSEKTEEVKVAAEEVAGASYIIFESVKRDEFAPTYMKNRPVSSNFEVVTNMYSAPSYGALDPNAVMGFFFSLFMGFIMADAVYGILMLLIGLWFASRQKSGSTIKRMVKTFAYSGIFALLFGVLFDSWFGFALIRNIAGENSAYSQFYAAHIDSILAPANIAGINVPAVLMWCMALGCVHIATAYVLKAVQLFGRGKYLEGVCGGLTWAIGLIGLVFTVFGIAKGLSSLTLVAGIITLSSVGTGVLTAGVGQRGAKAVLNVFTSAYGLINLASDILSYARLYGLMLSGAQIASIFSQTIAVGMLFPLGPVGVGAGVVIIIFGNIFNIAIGLLGAFIHDSRLQYVEFFGKFYEGDGELFMPLGSSVKHSYFAPDGKKKSA
jgi:V/A-type H+-transporting ATPase subunit I